MAGKEFENMLEKRNFSDEFWSIHLSEHALMAVQAWAEQQPDKPSLSEAIRRRLWATQMHMSPSSTPQERRRSIRPISAPGARRS